LKFRQGNSTKGKRPIAAHCGNWRKKQDTAPDRWSVRLQFLPDGFTNEVIHIYIARDLVKTSVNPDEDEFLEVRVYELRDIRQMIRDGRICDAKTISGLYLLQGENEPILC